MLRYVYIRISVRNVVFSIKLLGGCLCIQLLAVNAQSVDQLHVMREY